MSRRYTLSNLIKALQNPNLIQRETDEISKRAVSKLYELKNGPGIDVMEREWDNLILLDACRYDIFERECELNGDLQPVVSRGAHSWEFMQGNFVDRDLHDTVYVTANPHAEKLSDDVFYTVETVLDEWDPEIGTVLPKDVVSAAVDTHEKYPNKRLMIHFMQPHKPHIGPTADSIRDRVELRGWDKFHGHNNKKTERTGVHLWEAVKSGQVSIREVRRAYTESLDIVLDEVSSLIDELDGLTVISSDHGEMLGERGVIKRRFGHPHDIYNKELRLVPWLEFPFDARRDIVEEDPIGFERLDDSTVNQRLQALGYAPE